MRVFLASLSAAIALAGQAGFDVASVRPNKSADPATTNVLLGPGDVFPANQMHAVAEPETGAALHHALKEQLGLSLESTKTAIEVLVLDRVEHPAGN